MIELGGIAQCSECGRLTWFFAELSGGCATLVDGNPCPGILDLRRDSDALWAAIHIGGGAALVAMAGPIPAHVNRAHDLRGCV